MFFCEFCKISKNTFFTEHFWETASVFIFSKKRRNEFWCIVGLTTSLRWKDSTFLDLLFLLLLSERGLSPESCLAICYPSASCLKTGCWYKKNKVFTNIKTTHPIPLTFFQIYFFFIFLCLSFLSRIYHLKSDI